MRTTKEETCRRKIRHFNYIVALQHAELGHDDRLAVYHVGHLRKQKSPVDPRQHDDYEIKRLISGLFATLSRSETASGGQRLQRPEASEEGAEGVVRSSLATSQDSSTP